METLLEYGRILAVITLHVAIIPMGILSAAYAPEIFPLYILASWAAYYLSEALYGSHKQTKNKQ